VIEGSALTAIVVRNVLLDVALAFARATALSSARDVCVRVARISVELMAEHGGLAKTASLIAATRLWPAPIIKRFVVEAKSLVRLLLSTRRPLPLLVLIA